MPANGCGVLRFPTEHAWRAERYRLPLHHVILKLLSTAMRRCEIVSLELPDVVQRGAFITASAAHRIQQLLAQSTAVRSGD